MDNLDKLANKEFAYKCFELLKEQDSLNEQDINLLTNKYKCNTYFNSAFPILLEVSIYGEPNDADIKDAQGRNRYYKEKIFVNEKAFLITNHWYGSDKSQPDNRTPFMNWVFNKIK